MCNVLQIASKFYHLQYWIGEKIDQRQGKMHHFYQILLWIQVDTNLFELVMQHSQSTLHLVYAILSPHYCEMGEGGGH